MEMTLALAKALDVADKDPSSLRRGALLHDVGKLRVPEAVLQRRSPLTDEHWRLIRMHPVYAYEMLSPIEYLHPALDIPYCHHEKWDGSGYPRGLEGEAIPLAARIFAVADVYDALASPRPYRPPWPRPKIHAYILDQAGNHFDPQVVDAFRATFP